MVCQGDRLKKPQETTGRVFLSAVLQMIGASCPAKIHVGTGRSACIVRVRYKGEVRLNPKGPW